VKLHREKDLSPTYKLHLFSILIRHRTVWWLKSIISAWWSEGTAGM